MTLIATDVRRGIDVDNVEAVFNYDLPNDEEYYVLESDVQEELVKPESPIPSLVEKFVN